MQVSVYKEGWIDEEGIYLFACLFSFCFVTYQITKHTLSSTYLCKFDLARLFRTTIFIKVNDQHCVSFYSLEIVPVTVIKKNCFRKIFAYKKHPNFGGDF